MPGVGFFFFRKRKFGEDLIEGEGDVGVGVSPVARTDIAVSKTARIPNHRREWLRV